MKVKRDNGRTSTDRKDINMVAKKASLKWKHLAAHMTNRLTDFFPSFGFSWVVYGKDVDQQIF